MKNRTILAVIIPTVIILAVLAAAVILILSRIRIEAKPEAGDPGVYAEEAGYGLEYGSRSELVLSLEKGLFSAGSRETVSVSVRCPETAKTIRILDENGREAAVLENAGSTLVTGSLVIDEAEPRFGSFHAVSGDLVSPEIYFTVAPEISDGMVETLAEVCLDVRDYLAAAYPDGNDSGETLQAVRELLKEDSRVESSTIDGEVLLFRTTDGLMGMVDASAVKWTARGAVTAEEAYTLSGEGETDEETVVPAGAAVTNSRYLYVSPTNDDAIMAYGDKGPQKHLEHLAAVFGANYELAEAAAGEAMLRDGSITDAGFLVISAHGGTVSRRDGGRLLLLSIRDYAGERLTVTQDYDYSKEERKAILDSLTKNVTENEVYYGSDAYAENCNTILTISIRENQISPKFTATGLENGIGEKVFDNTVVFLAVCHSDADQHLQQFLADHGAAVIFTGVESMDVTRCTELFYMIDTRMTVQNPDGSYPAFEEAGLFPSQEELRAFRRTWDELGTEDPEGEAADPDWYTLMQDPEGNRAAIYRKIRSTAEEERKKKDKEHEENPARNPQTEYDDTLNWLAFRNYNAMWQSILESYALFVEQRNAYAENHEGRGDPAVEELLGKETPETIMRDYAAGNIIKCTLYAKGKTLGGTGTMTGTVLSAEDKQPAANIRVSVLRWIDHAYLPVTAGKTDAEGRYTIEDLPYGIYAVRASLGNAEDHACFVFSKETAEAPVLLLSVTDEDRYYDYLRETYGTGKSDLVSAYIRDFDFDGRKDLLTVTRGSVILANTPLGPFELYDGETEASTLDLALYRLDEENDVVRTGAILGAGTVEGHSRGTMSISLVLQDGKPYICGFSTNENETTYGARPYVVYEVLEGGGFRYDYVSGISWGQYAMGTSDKNDPNQIAGTYGLDVRGTQLSAYGEYGAVLCVAEADNVQSPHTFTATDYTRVQEGMIHGYGAVKGDLDALQEEMVLDARTFAERQERAKDTEGLLEIFVKELDAAGTTLVLKEYRTKDDTVTGIYTCQDVNVEVSVQAESGKLLSIELFADGYPVPDSWYTVKDAVLESSFAGLDREKIGELLGQTRPNLSVSNFDAGPATILAGNAGTIVLRITYR